MRIFKRRGSEVIDPQLTGLRFDQVGHSCCWILELETNPREVLSCIITEKAPIRAFCWLKVPTNAFTLNIIRTTK